ncbi:hypothetical protein [Streptomyces sp. NPDC047042]|uniref:hypothetical protein n=1 Tax=Streptomyces sp. NPDC047042 TaxID=3154807 RepID=UPI0033F6B529
MDRVGEVSGVPDAAPGDRRADRRAAHRHGPRLLDAVRAVRAGHPGQVLPVPNQ